MPRVHQVLNRMSPPPVLQLLQATVTAVGPPLTVQLEPGTALTRALGFKGVTYVVGDRVLLLATPTGNFVVNGPAAGPTLAPGPPLTLLRTNAAGTAPEWATLNTVVNPGFIVDVGNINLGNATHPGPWSPGMAFNVLDANGTDKWSSAWALHNTVGLICTVTKNGNETGRFVIDLNGKAWVRQGASGAMSRLVQAPDWTTADAGKLLRVQADGTLAWVTDAAVSVQKITAGFVAQTGFTVQGASATITTIDTIKWIKLAIQYTRTGALITIPANGDMTDTPFVQLPATVPVQTGYIQLGLWVGGAAMGTWACFDTANRILTMINGPGGMTIGVGAGLYVETLYQIG
jgi:hypothetical protein